MEDGRSRLKGVSITDPCPKRWDELEGGDVRRFCGECRLHVHDLSAMGRSAAEAFLASRSGRVCLTYRRRPDGRIATLEDRAPAPAGRRHGLLRAAASLFGGLFLAVVPGCAGGSSPDSTGSGEEPPEPDEGNARPDDASGGGTCPDTATDDDRLLGRMAAPLMGEVVLPEPVVLDGGEDPPRSSVE